MEKDHSRRHQPAGTAPPPRLSRSKSGTPAISLSELHITTSNSSLRSTNHRSKSTTKSRTNKLGQENSNVHLIMATPSIDQKKPREMKNNPSTFVKFLQRNQGSKSSEPKTRLTSPSAWALSPGRSLPCSPVQVSPSWGRLKSGNGNGNGNGGGVSGVLKFFKQKKVSRLQEEEFHRFRILHSRLLQWRFVNARAQAAMSRVKVVAQEKMFNVWLRILKLRNSIIQKRIQMQRLKHEMKLYQIINPQVNFLKEWGRLESRNSEAVGRLARKLSAISISLPLVHDAKAGLVCVNDAMNTAMEVMDSIEATMSKFFSQVERTCYLLTEFAVMVKQKKEHMEELEKGIVMVASLEAEEKSLRVLLIQVSKDSRGVEPK